MKRKILAIILVCVLILGLTACQDTQQKQPSGSTQGNTVSETQSDAEKLRIGYICSNPTHQGWLIISSAVEDAAKELEAEAELITIGLAQTDITSYMAALDDMLTMDVDAILLGGASSAMIDTIDGIVDSGIPIVEIDSPSGSTKTYNMGIDNEAAAAMGAAWMGEALGGKGTVVSINGYLGIESGRGRRDGFVNYMNENYPDITVFEVDTKFSQEEALNGIDDAFVALDQIDGVFCAWDGGTVVVQNNLAERGLTGKTLLCGFDGAADALLLMKEGLVDADVAQPLYGMGYEGFKTAFRLASGEEIAELHLSVEAKLVIPSELDAWIEEGHLQSYFG